MDLSDWDLAFGAASVHEMSHSTCQLAERVGVDPHPFTKAELERIRCYRAAIQAGYYNEGITTRRSPGVVQSIQMRHRP